jgi:hypothetical protein
MDDTNHSFKSSILVGREFLGIVLPDNDAKHQGKYKVHVPELQPHMSQTEGIWAKNQVHDYRVTPSQKGIYGSYYPLQPGTMVIVKFFDNQIETAYIERTISDHANGSLPLKTNDRDDYYQILRTPKKNHLIALCEETTDKPANSIHIYYNNKAITIVLDSNGININVTGATNIKSTTNINIQSDATINIKAATNVQVQAGGVVNVDAPTINLNCGNTASPATDPTLIDMTQEYSYFKNTDGSKK